MIPGMTDEMLEMYRKQWAAMGLDADAMLEQMKNSMAMVANAQSAAMSQAMQAANDASALQADPDFGFVFDDAPQINDESDITEARHFQAIACGANLAYLDNMYLNTLSSGKPQGQILAMLRNDWEINEREGLRSTIDWLMTDGHRLAFNRLMKKLKGIKQAEFASVVDSIATELEEDFDSLMETATNAIAGQQLLRGRGLISADATPSILTWDLGRAINLCRWGYDAGFLEKPEALEIITACATMLKSSYQSWADLSAGYLLGFYVWSGDEEELDDLVEGHELLLSHEKSPWVTLPWKV